MVLVLCYNHNINRYNQCPLDKCKLITLSTRTPNYSPWGAYHVMESIQNQTKRTVIKIGGMHCAGCVSSIQGLLSKISGVKKVEVNLATEKAAIEFDPSHVKLDLIENAITEIGYKVIYEKISLQIGGISDSSDSERIEHSLSQIEGIRSVSVNYGISQLIIEYNQALVSLADIRKKIGDLGYEILSETASESVAPANIIIRTSNKAFVGNNLELNSLN